VIIVLVNLYGEQIAIQLGTETAAVAMDLALGDGWVVKRVITSQNRSS
jgi:hypothetical protein